MAFSPAHLEWEAREFQHRLHSSSHHFCPSAKDSSFSSLPPPGYSTPQNMQADLKNEQGWFWAEEHGEPEFLQPGPLQSLATSLEETSCRELLTHTFLSLAFNSWFHVSCGAPDKHPPAPNLPSQPFGSRAFPLSEVSSPRQAHATCHDGSEPKDSLIPWKTAGPQTTRDPTPPGETYRRRDVVPLVPLPAEDKELGFCKHLITTAAPKMSSSHVHCAHETHLYQPKQHPAPLRTIPAAGDVSLYQSLCVCIIIYNCVS